MNLEVYLSKATKSSFSDEFYLFDRRHWRSQRRISTEIDQEKVDRRNRWYLSMNSKMLMAKDNWTTTNFDHSIGNRRFETASRPSLSKDELFYEQRENKEKNWEQTSRWRAFFKEYTMFN